MQVQPQNKLEMHAHESTGFNETQKMVTKRDGSLEPFSKDELTKHLSQMCDGLNKDHLNVEIVVGKVMMGLPKGKYPANLKLTHSSKCFRSQDHSNRGPVR